MFSFSSLLSAPLNTNLVLAQAESGSVLPSLLPLVFIFLIFYFLLIRPQSKRQKTLAKKREALKKGDVFITAGGLYAKVSHFKNDNLIVVAEIAPNVRVEVARGTIMDVVPKEEKKPVPASAKKSANKK